MYHPLQSDQAAVFYLHVREALLGTVLQHACVFRLTFSRSRFCSGFLFS